MLAPALSWVATFALGAASTFAALPSDVSLSAQAAASGRPPECALPKRAARSSVWERARVPQRDAYCGAVARASALLESDPKAALEAALEAERIWPDKPGAAVAKGRAELALGKADAALASLEAAEKLQAGSLQEAKAMHAHARALVLAGQLSKAADVYRALVPRVTLLPTRDRSRALVEAAFASMTDAARSERPEPMRERLREALAYLGEARGDGRTVDASVLLATALVHDRAGDREKATALLGELARAGTPAGLDLATLVAEPADAKALAALDAESGDPRAAARAWDEYLAQAKDPPFLEAAQARRAALGKGKPGSTGKPKKPKGAKP